jgi:hypothetical protein
LHATGAHLTTVDAALIGAVPPLVCVLSAHLLLLLLTAPGTTPAPKTRAGEGHAGNCESGRAGDVV